MKVNQNMKIRPNYKTLGFLLLFGLAGCKKYEHKNVITEIGTIDNRPVLVLKDVETDIERIYESADYDYKYSASGDTVTIRVGFGSSSRGERYYKNHRVLNFNQVLYLNDSISHREKYEKVKKEAEKFDRLRQKLQSR